MKKSPGRKEARRLYRMWKQGKLKPVKYQLKTLPPIESVEVPYTDPNKEESKNEK